MICYVHLKLGIQQYLFSHLLFLCNVDRMETILQLSRVTDLIQVCYFFCFKCSFSVLAFVCTNYGEKKKFSLSCHPAIERTSIFRCCIIKLQFLIDKEHIFFKALLCFLGRQQKLLGALGNQIQILKIINYFFLSPGQQYYKMHCL